MNPTPHLISILGPTASGKSAVAVLLAQRLGGEVVSCDSMMVYRGLDIGTAKPTLAERGGVPHHLIDCFDLHEACRVADFAARAHAACEEILARGRWPILCGGTGQYAQALLEGLSFPPFDEAVAVQIQSELSAGKQEDLVAELASHDPVEAAALATNHRRLARAVAILRLTGMPPAAWGRRASPPPWRGPVFILMPSAELSRERITIRTRAMLTGGWLAETEHLVAQGLLAAPTAGQALGYPQIAAWLAAGGHDLATLEAELITLTARYAKRQRTWFRHQHPGAIMIPVSAQDSPASISDRISLSL
jgi:tRNA dimethylallyltransferase